MPSPLQDTALQPASPTGRFRRSSSPLEGIVLPALETAGCEPQWLGNQVAFHCPCPYHSNGDRTPSGRAGEDEDGHAFLKCWTSGAGSRELAPLIGLHVRQLFAKGSSPRGEHQPISRPPLAPPDPLDDHVQRWVEEAHEVLLATPGLVWNLALTRGLAEPVIRRARLGWDHESHEVVIPYFDPDGLVYNIDRWTPPWRRTPDTKATLRAWPGARRWMYVPDRESLAEDVEIVVCEGAMDALAGLSAGLPCVAAPSASTWHDEFAQELHHLGVTRAAVVGDCDEAGRRFAARAVPSLTSAGIDARALDLALFKGGDLTDWILGARHV